MAAAPRWRDTYVRREMVDPATLVANPLNARRHPAAQIDALEGSLDELGWIDEITVNERTGRMTDGHARVELALARGEPLVPVTYRAMTEAEERKALLIKDPIGALAETDGAALDTLLAQVDTANAGLQTMLAGMAGDAHLYTELPADDPLAGMDPGDGRYKEQYGVIVVCADEAEQQRVYERLSGEGLACRVVVT